ncbi:hypothetical protein NSMM_490015 [Nitrosomonas mobilis]|uniref:Uncharacterized protein n=1 Tax=Nitrosomonas mobilis TaxID=51642 RepID=A0A1G5SG04_9PROT|nr:hypothetical protein [Nitrosomonas mobilis]SCZ86126.1 hypothetical protein NSMM_490015 [Nitrosomonas mobilis]
MEPGEQPYALLPPTAQEAKFTPIAGKSHQFLMGAACTTQA